MDVNNNTIINISQYPTTKSDIAIPNVPQSQDLKDNNKEYNSKDIDEALKKINNFLKGEHTHAEYSYHKELKTMMIKVIDEDTKEVVLEIPPKKILDMVASMLKQVGLLDKKA